MILIKQDHVWVRANLNSYQSEAALRDLLAGDGSLVPGCGGAAAVTEFRVRSGSIDVVYVDGDGVVTLVECKLRSNRQIRREVVGQLIDYASALRGMSYQHFAATFATRNKSVALEEAVRAGAAGDVDLASFKTACEGRLSKGQFRLIVAVDEITEDLQRSIEYLNENSTDAVVFIALELGYLKRGDVEILVPRTFGAEVEVGGKGPKSTTKVRWTAEQLEEAVASINDTKSREFVRALLDHAKSHGATVKGGTGAAPSAGFYYPVGGVQRSLWSLYARPDDPVVAINFGSISNVSKEITKAAYGELSGSPAIMSALDGGFDDVAAKYPEIAVLAMSDDPAATPALLKFFGKVMVTPQPTNATPIADGSKN